MRKSFTILLLLLLNSTSTFCGNLDSLFRELRKAKEDTGKVNTLLAIENEYVKKDPDSALYYLDQCRNLLHKINDTANEHRCYYEYIVIYHSIADYQTALQYCLKTIDIARKYKNKQHEARSYRALFNLYHNLRKSDLAIKYGIYSIQFSQAIGDTLNIATNYGNLCWLYIDLRQYQKAIYYGEKGIMAGKKYNDIKGLLISINNTALAYRQVGNNEKSRQLLEEQLAIAQKENIPRSVHKALTNLCMLYADVGDRANVNKYTTAYNRYITDNHVSLNNKDKSYGYIINAYNSLFGNNFRAAEQHITDGLKIAEADSISDALLELYQIYANLKYAEHDYPRGEYYLGKWDSVDQSTFEEEMASLSMDLETKYETQKKENEILKQQQQLKKRKNLIIAFSCSIAVLLMFLLLLFRYFKSRNSLLEKERIIQEQKITELENEKQLTAVTAILNGQEEERSRIAKDLHDGLGGLLSGVKYSLNTMKENVLLSAENAQSFERTIDMLDSGIQELRRVAHNMMPENLIKFGLDTGINDYCDSISKTGKLQVSYNSFGMENYAADSSISITVYRVIQELINNAMKHANATECIVQVEITEDTFHLTVEDNGTGFDTNNLNNFKGAGWTNIQHRINYLRGKITLDSGQQGTTVQIEIPLK